EFIKKLESTYHHIPIKRFDERFTSKMAFDTMIASGIGKKKRQNKGLVDKISATIILQGYLDTI
ncbi:MAG: RuvX/YqgF family protein, partial [Wenyingzhuangia sp.]